MKFIYELYQNDNFTIYLTIALVVLVVLFVVVLLFGKRDQKLEETKKLQKIELEKNKKEEKAEEKSLQSEERQVEVTTFEPIEKEVTEEKVEEKEDSKPLFAEESDDDIALDLPTSHFDEEGLEKDLTELENIKKEFNDIKLPEEPKKEEKPKEVFSSVYGANEKKETSAPQVFVDDEEDEMELPSLKNSNEEEKTEEPKEESVEETKEEKTILEDQPEIINPFNFEEVSGETYSIK